MHVEFSNISKSYGWGKAAKHALVDVSWEAQSGRVLGILGPNGAGKSTCLRILLGLLQPDQGHLSYAHGDISVYSERFRHSVGFLTEERAIYKSSRVCDVIHYFALLKGLTTHEAKRRTNQLLEIFELQEYRYSPCQRLSKGLSQRVQFATALVHSPSLLILDEPLSGLDPVATSIVRKLLLQLKQEGTTIILCSHQMKEIEAICDNVVLLVRGQVLLSGALTSIRQAYGAGAIFVEGDSRIRLLPVVQSAEEQDKGFSLRLSAEKSIHDLISAIVAARLSVSRIEQLLMPLEDIFVKLVQERERELEKDSAHC